MSMVPLNSFFNIEVIVNVSVIFSDKLSFLSFISESCWSMIIENSVCSKSCKKKNFQIMKHASWGRSVSPLENRKSLWCMMSIHFTGRRAGCCSSIWISCFCISSLIVITTNFEYYLWRASLGRLYIFKHSD